MSKTNPYNDPFYFALPRGAKKGDVSKALAHISATFGVRGKAEHVRSELAFHLFRISEAAR
jgi:hypothetical protein